MLSHNPFRIVIFALLILAGAAGLFAAVVLFAFVRTGEAVTSTGVIVAKTFVDERTVSRLNPGVRREVWSRREYTIQPSYVFTIQLAGGAGIVRYALERTAGDKVNVGDVVTVTFERRGLPPLWIKRFVRTMTVR